MKTSTIKKPKIKLYSDGYYFIVRKGLRRYRFFEQNIKWASPVRWVGIFGNRPCSFIIEGSGNEFKSTLSELYAAEEYEKVAYCLLAYVKQYRRRHITMIIRLLKAIRDKIRDAIKWLGK